MRTGIDKAKSAEDLWLGFKKLCPAEIFLSVSFFLFFFFILHSFSSSYLSFLYPSNIPSSSLSKLEKIRWKNGENSFGYVSRKKKKKRTRLCSYYFLMVHSSLLLPRPALQSKHPLPLSSISLPLYLLLGRTMTITQSQGGRKFRSIRRVFAYDSHEIECAV